MVRRVDAWETSDGRVFGDEREAEAHEVDLEFDAAYEADPILGNYAGSQADVTDVKVWLIDNAGLVLSFLKRKMSDD